MLANTGAPLQFLFSRSVSNPHVDYCLLESVSIGDIPLRIGLLKLNSMMEELAVGDSALRLQAAGQQVKRRAACDECSKLKTLLSDVYNARLALLTINFATQELKSSNARANNLHAQDALEKTLHASTRRRNRWEGRRSGSGQRMSRTAAALT